MMPEKISYLRSKEVLLSKTLSYSTVFHPTNASNIKPNQSQKGHQTDDMFSDHASLSLLLADSRLYIILFLFQRQVLALSGWS